LDKTKNRRLLVLFLDNTCNPACPIISDHGDLQTITLLSRVYEIMETIDDDCDDLGVSFVAVRDRALAAR
jgi:hypothetical protein